MAVPALLVTWAPGAGKTALAKEIGEQLFHADVAHAVIDLDELTVAPEPGDNSRSTTSGRSGRTTGRWGWTGSSSPG